MGKIILNGQDYSGGDLTSVSLWSSTTSYNTDDLVMHLVVVYKATKASVGQEPSSTSEYWTPSTVGDVMNALNRKLQPATATQAGVSKPDGTTITIDADGTLHGSTNVSIATTSAVGTVKPDGSTIKIDTAGTISVDSTSLGLGTAASSNVATSAIAEDSTDTSVVTAAQVATFVKGEVADIAGVMHFKGVVERTGSETDAEAIATAITSPEAGDFVVMADNSKEYVYANSTWRELGNEGLYVLQSQKIAGIDLADDITTAELKAALDIDDLETAVGTKADGTLYNVSTRIHDEAEDAVYSTSTASCEITGTLTDGSVIKFALSTPSEWDKVSSTATEIDLTGLGTYTLSGTSYSVSVSGEYSTTTDYITNLAFTAGGTSYSTDYNVPITVVTTLSETSIKEAIESLGTNVTSLKEEVGVYVKDLTLTAGHTTFEFNIPSLKSDSIVDVVYSDSTMETAQEANITYTQEDGKLTITLATAYTTDIKIDYIHVLNA